MMCYHALVLIKFEGTANYVRTSIEHGKRSGKSTIGHHKMHNTDRNAYTKIKLPNVKPQYDLVFEHR